MCSLITAFRHSCELALVSMMRTLEPERLSNLPKVSQLVDQSYLYNLSTLGESAKMDLGIGLQGGAGFHWPNRSPCLLLGTLLAPTGV